MRLARRALVAALVTLLLCAAAATQTVRSENAPGNSSLLISTGGATGLFAVYDSQTLRRGEFTFNTDYSNFARDAVNLAIAEVPLTVQYRHIGDRARNFRQETGDARKVFALARFNVTPGLPQVATNSETFDSANTDANTNTDADADNILPRIIWATTNIGPNVAQDVITVPATFTIALIHLPDSPLINRLYGESSLSTAVAGCNICFTGGAETHCFWLKPLVSSAARQYRRWNRMIPGPGVLSGLDGGYLDDFGLLLSLDRRLSHLANVSANFGYLLNSNPKDLFTSGGFILLDGPEFPDNIGVDFPINRYVQRVSELRSTQYVGSRTPYTFENSLAKAVASARIRIYTNIPGEDTVIVPARSFSTWQPHPGHHDSQSSANRDRLDLCIELRAGYLKCGARSPIDVWLFSYTRRTLVSAGVAQHRDTPGLEESVSSLSFNQRTNLPARRHGVWPGLELMCLGSVASVKRPILRLIKNPLIAPSRDAQTLGELTSKGFDYMSKGYKWSRYEKRSKNGPSAPENTRMFSPSNGETGPRLYK